MEFDCFTQIKPIRAYSLQYGRMNQYDKALELLRFITTSPNLPDYLFLNRGYRRLESVNTNTWKVMRGWSKQDLDYGNQDRIGLITCSYDGSYLAMKIKSNERLWFIDLRKCDDQLTLIKRISMQKGSVFLLHRIQVPFDQEKWLIIDAKNKCYKVSANPNDMNIISMRTDDVQAIESVPIHLRFVRNNEYVLVSAVVGDSRRKQGVLKFYKLSAS
ncbi:unnamed protein product [Adineta steineri]|uniref:Uncharacterized protein n=1 Tax=Adineta steineri TaxID=433720 RepID=A0A819PA91_9BILA|nr:unnamed protein product [Adineta steineri]CAF4011674.1 unnamed protein product [Adineta steineri]